MGDRVQAECPVEDVLLERLGAHDLGGGPERFAAQHVELKQAILGDGVAEGEEQVAVAVGLNVRHAASVASDGRRAGNARNARRPGVRRQAPPALLFPEGVELRPGQLRLGADALDGLAPAQASQDVAGIVVGHGVSSSRNRRMSSAVRSPSRCIGLIMSFFWERLP